jgi:cytosine/adenosine deaminase-related metal-dependent hydrolase
MDDSTWLWLAGARLADAGADGVGSLAVAGGHIVDRRDGSADGGGVSLGGQLVLPGLVNGHDHLHLNLFRPVRPRRPFRSASQWVDEMRSVIETPALRRLRALPVALRAWHGAVKNVLAGATTVVHHDPWLPVFDDPLFPVTVARDVGWAHSLDLAGEYGPEVAESFAATPPGRPWFIHLAEGVDAAAGQELERLAGAGCLDDRVRLVHAIALGAAGRERALAAGAGMVWCPLSNAALFRAVADPAAFAEAGRAALGTDSRLTGARDLLDELAFAAAVSECPAETLWRMVTDRGAAIAGADGAGRLAPGSPADLVVLADDGRPPAEQLVGAGRADLRLVMARGRPAVADPDLTAVFQRLGEPYQPACLDGRPKLVASRILAPLRAAGIEEPGLAVAPDGHGAAGG